MRGCLQFLWATPHASGRMDDRRRDRGPGAAGSGASKRPLQREEAAERRAWAESIDALVDFERTKEAGDLDRLAADQEVVLQLQLAGYEGPKWDYFANVLAAYGFSVIRAWLIRGVMVQRCLANNVRRGLPRGRLAGPLSPDDAVELASEIVAESINSFRDQVLKRNLWDPGRGAGRAASLKTFFVGQCLIRYPDVMRRWRTEQEKWGQVDLRDVEPEQYVAPDRPDKEVVAALNLEEARASVDPRTLRVLELQSDGYQQQEIADVMGHGMTRKMVEAILYRHRQRVRKREG
jgi:hypothetical protein